MALRWFQWIVNMNIFESFFLGLICVKIFWNITFKWSHTLRAINPNLVFIIITWKIFVSHRVIIVKLLASNYCRSKLCQDIITFFLSARILSLFSRQNVMVTDTYTMISHEFYIFPTVYCFNIHLFFQKYTIWIESLCFAFCCFSCCFKTFIFPKQHWIQEEMNSVESFFLKGSAIFI